ncbi:MAG TPA: hypothetical protein PKD54_06045 [Pirellulaceae bacterium]|nr:hypothetical protein [Pirellulaceae bacterium]
MTAVLAILGTNLAVAQDNAGVAALLVPMLKDPEVHVPDAGIVRHRSRVRTSHEILENALPAYMNNSVCSKKVADGTTIYDIIHESKPPAITVHDDGQVEIRMIRRYNRHNIDQLKSDQPDLVKHNTSIPKAIEGNQILDVSVEIEIAVTATNADELKANHPDMHDIFARYTKQLLVIQSKKLRVIEESK